MTERSEQEENQETVSSERVFAESSESSSSTTQETFEDDDRLRREVYKKNYTYEDYLREQQEETARTARTKSNLAVSSMPAFSSLEDVLRYFLYEESGIILDAGADKLEESLVAHNIECVAINKSMIALTTRKQAGFLGEVIVASITALPFKENAFVRCASSKGLESLGNTIEVTNALVELSRVSKTTIITLRRYGQSIVHRVIFTRMFVDRLVKGVGIHYGILKREDGDFVIYLLSKGLQSPQSLAMEYAGESITQKLVGRARAKQIKS